METNKGIKELIGIVGSIVVGLFFVGCPALLACSIIYDLPYIFFLVSIPGTLGELLYVILSLAIIWWRTNEE